MTKLTDEALGLIKKYKPLFIKMQIALEVTERTMYNYVNSNDDALTKVSAMNELVEYTQKPLSSLTVEGVKLSKLLSK